MGGVEESMLTGGSIFEESINERIGTKEILQTEDLLDYDEMEISNEIPSETYKSKKVQKHENDSYDEELY